MRTQQLEGLIEDTTPSKPEQNEPEEGFGGGGGGECCEHPECAVERMIESAADTIVEGIYTFTCADWGLSEQIRERLTSLVQFLEIITGEEDLPPIGEVYPLDRKNRDAD